MEQTQTPQPTIAQASTPASLYVGDLNPEVTEGVLFEIFNSIGAVASIRVCRDTLSRRSLGYAYVNFHDSKDAERASEELNNVAIKGRPCRIMWAQRDSAVRKSGKGNIFIKNLDKSIDYRSLFDTFSQFGTVLSCKIELDEKNVSKGFGYIQFQTPEAADTAIEKVNGMLIAGKKVFVGHFIPRKDRTVNSEKSFTNIFVKNLDASVDEKQLEKLFSKFGVIKSAVIMRENGVSKGFGFVDFEQPDNARSAVEEMNEKEFSGRQIFVGRAMKKGEREGELRAKFEMHKIEQLKKSAGVNLYVKNLDDDVTDEGLRNLFQNYGNITSVKVMGNPNGTSKGFGFVCFSAVEEATRAVAEMNMKMVGSKPLYVGLAQRKDVRRSQLELQFAQRAKIVSAMMGNGVVMPPYFPQVFYPPYPGRSGGNRGGPRNFGSAPNSYHSYPPRGGRNGPTRVNRGRFATQPRRTQRPQQQVQQSQDPKQELGERLYVLIEALQPQLAGKITGMIYEVSSVPELTELIEDSGKLQEKVLEALEVLGTVSN